jgi:hypothetical protein
MADRAPHEEVNDSKASGVVRGEYGCSFFCTCIPRCEVGFTILDSRALGCSLRSIIRNPQIFLRLLVNKWDNEPSL